MKKYPLTIIAVSFFLAFPLISHAAIARDASSTVNTTSQNPSWTHTAVGNPSVAVVAFSLNGTMSDIVSSVTFGGTNMTQVGKQADTLGQSYAYLYKISSSTQKLTGSNTVQINLTSSNLVRAVAMTYTGTDITNPVDASSSTNGNGSTITTTLTTNNANEYGFNWTEDLGCGSCSVGTNETLIVQVGNNLSSDQAIPTAGSFSMTTNVDSVRAVALMLALKPAAPAIPYITLSTSSYAFNTTFTTSTEKITNTGQSGSTLSWTATTSQPWLTLSSLSGTATSTITLTSAGWGYAPGTYNASATVTDAGGTATDSPIFANVSMTVYGASTSTAASTVSYWSF